MANAPRGQVIVQADTEGNLTLQIPSIHAKRYYQRKQKYIRYGAKNTPQNRIDAMKAALELQSDLDADKFDPQETNKYKHLNKNLVAYVRSGNANLIDLYNDYVKHKLLEETTRRGSCKTALNHLTRMIQSHNYTLKQQLEISIWIRNNVSQSGTIRLLGTLNQMIEWGKQESRLSKDFENKFSQYAQDFRKSLRGSKVKRQPPKSVRHLIPKTGIQAWSESERDVIIQAFHNRKRQKQHRSKLDSAAFLIEFLFLTGCRHGEAFALTWNDIVYGTNDDHEPIVTIRIDKSFDGQFRITKGTKTGKNRVVPANKRVQEILETLKPEKFDPNLLVFRNVQGNHFTTNALHSYWTPGSKQPVLEKLILEGTLKYYMDVYSTRRTFVSIQLNKGVPPNTVAMWVGDNTETILKHYARPDDEAVPY